MVPRSGGRGTRHPRRTASASASASALDVAVQHGGSATSPFDHGPCRSPPLPSDRGGGPPCPASAESSASSCSAVLRPSPPPSVRPGGVTVVAPRPASRSRVRHVGPRTMPHPAPVGPDPLSVPPSGSVPRCKACSSPAAALRRRPPAPSPTSNAGGPHHPHEGSGGISNSNAGGCSSAREETGGKRRVLAGHLLAGHLLVGHLLAGHSPRALVAGRASAHALAGRCARPRQRAPWRPSPSSGLLRPPAPPRWQQQQRQRQQEQTRQPRCGWRGRCGGTARRRAGTPTARSRRSSGT